MKEEGQGTYIFKRLDVPVIERSKVHARVAVLPVVVVRRIREQVTQLLNFGGAHHPLHGVLQSKLQCLVLDVVVQVHRRHDAQR